MLKISAQPQFIQQMSVQYVGMLLEFKSSEQKEQSLKTSKWKSCRDYTWEKYIVEKSFIFLNIVSQNGFFFVFFLIYGLPRIGKAILLKQQLQIVQASLGEMSKFSYQGK